MNRSEVTCGVQRVIRKLNVLRIYPLGLLKITEIMIFETPWGGVCTYIGLISMAYIYKNDSTSILYLLLKHGSTQQLKPYQRRSSKTPIVRPLSRKDIFYSGSIYNLALDLTTDDEKENKQIADLNALKGYRHSVVSIPRNITFSHRGSIGKCMQYLSYALK